MPYVVYFDREEKGNVWHKRRFVMENRLHAETLYRNANMLIATGNPHLRNVHMAELCEHDYAPSDVS